MALTSGYLVTYTKNNIPFATLYDEYLNFVEDIDPNSQEVLEHIKNTEEVTGLEDEMWEEVLGELSSTERSEAVVYRLENEVLTNSEINMEETMEENDDEFSPGYNG